MIDLRPKHVRDAEAKQLDEKGAKEIEEQKRKASVKPKPRPARTKAQEEVKKKKRIEKVKAEANWHYDRLCFNFEDMSFVGHMVAFDKLTKLWREIITYEGGDYEAVLKEYLREHVQDNGEGCDYEVELVDNLAEPAASFWQRRKK